MLLLAPCACKTPPVHKPSQQRHHTCARFSFRTWTVSTTKFPFLTTLSLWKQRHSFSSKHGVESCARISSLSCLLVQSLFVVQTMMALQAVVEGSASLIQIPTSFLLNSASGSKQPAQQPLCLSCWVCASRSPLMLVSCQLSFGTSVLLFGVTRGILSTLFSTTQTHLSPSTGKMSGPG